MSGILPIPMFHARDFIYVSMYWHTENVFFAIQVPISPLITPAL